MEFAQASYLSGQPRLASSRISIREAPASRRSLGGLYLLLEGGTEAMCSSFAGAAGDAYYSDDTASAISGLMRGMRAGSSAASAAAGPDEERLEVGTTGVVIRGRDLFIAQLLPAQLFLFRGNELNSRPEYGADSELPMNRLPFDKDIEILRASLVDGDTIVLSSSVVAMTLHEREIRGLLVRYPPEDSAYQIATLAAQRGAPDCDVLILTTDSTRSHSTASPGNGVSLQDMHKEKNAIKTSSRDSGLREPDWSAAELEVAASIAPRAPKSTMTNITDSLIGLGLLVLVLPTMLVKGIARTLVPAPTKEIDSQETQAISQVDVSTKSDYEQRRLAIASGPQDFEELNRTVLEANQERIHSPWPARQDYSSNFFQRMWASLFDKRDPLASRTRSRSHFGLGSAILLFSVVALVVVLLIMAIRRQESSTVGTEEPARVQDQGIPKEQSMQVQVTAAATAFAEAKAHFDAAIRETERLPALAGLQDALDAANEAINAGYNEAEINRLLAQIQSEQDRLNQVYRLVTSATIDEFNGAGVGVSRIVPQLEVRQNVQYIIDAVEKRLIEYRVAKRGSVVLREGEQIGQVAIQDIVGMVARELSLLVIDSEFRVFSIVPDRPAQILRVSGTDQWKLPVALDNFNNNLYILDPAANRIHKYQPTANGYEVDPINYFDPSQSVDVSTAIDMAIDGDIFVLLSDGTIDRFRAGKKLKFQIRGLDRPISKATRIYTDVEAESIYIVDDGNDRIVEIDKRDGNEGVFVRQFLYRGADNFFGDIRAISVSELQGRLLILGVGSLRQFVLPKRVQ